MKLTYTKNRIQLCEMRLEAVLDQVQRLIDRGDARMSDLARHLGKNWNQCHEWIVKRNHKPSAEVALGMMDFIAINDKSNSRNIEHKATDGFSELFVDGRKLTELERDLWIENNMLKTMIASQIGKHDKG